jgi:hypothetical protein
MLDTEAAKAVPAQTGHGLPKASLCGSNNSPDNPTNLCAPQADFRNPRPVIETRLWPIRRAISDNLDEIRVFAEGGMLAVEVEILDLGRAFDQVVKHFRSVAGKPGKRLFL